MFARSLGQVQGGELWLLGFFKVFGMELVLGIYNWIIYCFVINQFIVFVDFRFFVVLVEIGIFYLVFILGRLLNILVVFRIERLRFRLFLYFGNGIDELRMIRDVFCGYVDVF